MTPRERVLLGVLLVENDPAIGLACPMAVASSCAAPCA